MDGYALDVTYDAADAGRKSKVEEDQNVKVPDPIASVFSFATSWGQKLQNNAKINKFVNEVKSESEDMVNYYKKDFENISEAIKTGATRGIDEINSRINQLNTKDDVGQKATATTDNQRSVDISDENATTTTNIGTFEQAKSEVGNFFAGLKQQFQKDKMKERQTQFQNIMKGLGNDLEELLKEAIVIEAPDSGATEKQRAAARKIIYDQKKAEITKIQNDINTFLTEVPTQDKKYLETFDLAQKDEKELEDLLEGNSEMSKLYQELVPSKLEREEFWKRYFYKIWLLDNEDERRKKLVREAAVAANESEDFDWENDDEEDDDDEKEGKSSNVQSSKVDKDSKGESKLKDKATTKPEEASSKPTEKESAKPEAIDKDAKKGKDGDASDEDWDNWE